jgi:hypothetical protein
MLRIQCPEGFRHLNVQILYSSKHENIIERVCGISTRLRDQLLSRLMF